MSYNIGQFRRSQLSSYEDKVTLVKKGSAVGLTTVSIATEEGLSLTDTALVLESKLEKGENYYFSFYTKATSSLSGAFIVYLYDANNEIFQPLKRFNVGPGTFCELVFTPNDINYNKLVFKKVVKSSQSDRVYIDDTNEGSWSEATYTKMELWKLINLIPLLEDVSYVKKIGVQGPPGLMFAMNGEEIHIGKSGLYEADGINISTLSFVIKNRSPIPYEDGKDYFILDYLY